MLYRKLRSGRSAFHTTIKPFGCIESKREFHFYVETHSASTNIRFSAHRPDDNVEFSSSDRYSIIPAAGDDTYIFHIAC